MSAIGWGRGGLWRKKGRVRVAEAVRAAYMPMLAPELVPEPIDGLRPRLDVDDQACEVRSSEESHACHMHAALAHQVGEEASLAADGSRAAAMWR